METLIPYSGMTNNNIFIGSLIRLDLSRAWQFGVPRDTLGKYGTLL
jgi:hypothetical protein